MSADPRKFFTVKHCEATNKANAIEVARRRTALESITKLGDLEILNDTGFGKVGEGLRVLAAVSDSVRVGQSSVPGREGSDTYNSTLGRIANTALDAVDQGAQIVLDTTGLNGAVESVGDFNPGVANRAYGQAKSIFDQVKRGNFQISDIPHVFSDLQNLEQLARGIFNTRKSPPKRDYALCSASPYAMDLIAYAPKFNFLFVMDIQFAPEYAQWSDIGSHMAFVVKRSTRPSVEFDYEEVNMYNFWTRVPKRVNYPPVSMSFYDDNKNAAHLFYTGYTRAMSPIANRKQDDPQSGSYEINSMNFSQSAPGTTFGEGAPQMRGYSSSLGPLLGDTTSIISRIRLYHIFDYGKLMNIYNFYNPRILSFTPTELNMAETGDGAEFEFQFAYDGMFIEPGFSVQEGGYNKNLEEVSSNRGTAQYPIKPIFNDDDVPRQDNSQQVIAPIAQEQLESGTPSDYFATTVGEFSTAGGGTGTNFTSGATGGMNVISNAFTSARNFVGSMFS
jgi:hypothetical protein